MEPEAAARKRVDHMLEEAGWVPQDRTEMDRQVALGVAVREFALAKGEADYLLSVGDADGDFNVDRDNYERDDFKFTLKKDPLQRADLDNFVACYKSGKRGQRKPSERFCSFTYDELIARDKTNLDIFWLKDNSLEDASNLPPPDVLVAEIIEALETALEEFRGVAEELGK